MPEAPGTFEMGSATPRSGWLIAASCRAIESAPPPVPHGTMKSMGRLGYFSCARAAGTSVAIESVSVAKATRPDRTARERMSEAPRRR